MLRPKRPVPVTVASRPDAVGLAAGLLAVETPELVTGGPPAPGSGGSEHAASRPASAIMAIVGRRGEDVMVMAAKHRRA